MASSKKDQPKELITFLCTRCRWDFSRTERDKPKCTLCGKNDRLKEMGRQPMSQQALEVAMMRSMERLMTGLEGAYEAQQRVSPALTSAEGSTRETEKKNDEEEILLLEAMVKAKNLQKHVEKAFGKGPARKKKTKAL